MPMPCCPILKSAPPMTSSAKPTGRVRIFVRHRTGRPASSSPAVVSNPTRRRTFATFSPSCSNTWRWNSYGSRGRSRARGQNHHAKIYLEIEDTFIGAMREINLRVPKTDAQGCVSLETRTLSVNPRDVCEGRLIRLAGQGEPGLDGAPAPRSRGAFRRVRKAATRCGCVARGSGPATGGFATRQPHHGAADRYAAGA